MKKVILLILKGNCLKIEKIALVMGVSLFRLGDSFYVFPNTTNNTLSHKKENENISVNANLVFFRKRKPKALCGLSEQKLG